jgi:hypothetical protein
MARKRPFSLLRPGLSPAFEALGFKKVSVAWQRPHGEAEYLACDFQPWKWGYDPWFGSSFTMNFQRRPIVLPEAEIYKVILDARILDLTDEADRQEIMQLQNAVLAKGHIPTPEEYRALYPYLSFRPEHYEKMATPVSLADLAT